MTVPRGPAPVQPGGGAIDRGGPDHGGYVIACDFDGTITVNDVTNLIWDGHLDYDWRSVLLPPSVAGEITPLEMIARGYAGVRQPAVALLEELRPQVRLREDFHRFHELCARSGWPFQVISYGLSVYLRAFLPDQVSYTAFEAQFIDGAWRVEPPPGISLPEAADFKVPVVEALRLRFPGRAVVYIGDGRLDFPAARRADRIFAVQGSTLARMCSEQQVPFAEFQRFDEVASALTAAPAPPAAP